jgi:hypothetical protein
LKKIINYEIDSNLKKPLFNYPSFIKTFDTLRIELHVLNWTSSASHNVTSTSVQQPSLYLPLTLIGCFELRSDVNNDKIKVVCNILFKLFTENNASLDNLNMLIIDNNYLRCVSK